MEYVVVPQHMLELFDDVVADRADLCRTLLENVRNTCVHVRVDVNALHAAA